MSFYSESKNITEESVEQISSYLGAGNHRVEIVAMEEKETTTGGRMLVIDFKNDFEMFGIMRLNIVNKNEKAIEISKKHFQQILLMAGEPYKSNFNISESPLDLISAKIYVFGKERTYTDSSGVTKKGVDFAPDQKIAYEIFHNNFTDTDFNDAPLDKYDPFDQEAPF